MAEYTLTQRAVHDKTLAANTADTVIVDTQSSQAQLAVEVLTDGTADVYVSMDGTPASISGENTVKVPASGGSSSVVVSGQEDSSGDLSVSLISAGTPKYSVTRV